MDEDVATGREAGDVDVLALQARHVVVAEAGREALANSQPRGLSTPAFLRPDGICRLAGKPDARVRVIAVAEAKAGLVVATDGLARRRPELVALEAE